MDNKDPLCKFMVKKGFSYEQDIANPTNTVFAFPMKSPKESMKRTSMSALEQLELWRIYAVYYCEHKPSVTISVKENEWLDVGTWVYTNFGVVSGISFLPFSDHNYIQAPYEDCTEKEYKQLIKKGS